MAGTLQQQDQTPSQSQFLAPSAGPGGASAAASNGNTQSGEFNFSTQSASSEAKSGGSGGGGGGGGGSGGGSGGGGTDVGASVAVSTALNTAQKQQTSSTFGGSSSGVQIGTLVIGRNRGSFSGSATASPDNSTGGGASSSKLLYGALLVGVLALGGVFYVLAKGGRA